ncbi:MAG: NADPH-dependent F420 reductase [Haloarculaceae archaeon]
MNVGIIGTGAVGTALATGLTAAGHDVVVGSRDPDANRIEGVTVDTQRAAAEHGAAVILAVPDGVVLDVVTELRDALDDTALLDATNEYPEPRADEPLARRVADAAPAAAVVKAFNTVGAGRMTDPDFEGEAATMFLAGDDPAAVDAAAVLARDLGFEPAVAGDLSAARHLEHLARFWIDLSSDYGQDIAFRFLREAPGE